MSDPRRAHARRTRGVRTVGAHALCTTHGGPDGSTSTGDIGQARASRTARRGTATRSTRRRNRARCGVVRRGGPGPYQVQAAIAACHATAAETAATDWVEIAMLYGQLPGCVADARRRAEPRRGGGHGRRARCRPGLVDDLDTSGALAGYHLLPATRADLLRRSGRLTEAAGALPLGVGPGDERRRPPLPRPPVGRGGPLPGEARRRLRRLRTCASV